MANGVVQPELQYVWNWEDADLNFAAVGGNFLSGAHVLTENDGYGGYNVEFDINGEASKIHVHFLAGTRKITSVQFLASSGAISTNVFRIVQNGTPQSSGALRNAIDARYPNHAFLLSAITSAMGTAFGT